MRATILLVVLLVVGCEMAESELAPAELAPVTSLQVQRVAGDPHGYRVTAGDLHFYLTDRYNYAALNPSGLNNYGGGLLQLREVLVRGIRALAYTQLDYALEVSAPQSLQRQWLGYQSGLESDAMSLTVLIDGAARPLELGETVTAQNFKLRYTTIGWLPDYGPVVAWEWEREVDASGRIHGKVTRRILQPVRVWTEYVGTAGGTGSCAWPTTAPRPGVRWDRVVDEAGALDLGCRDGAPSEYIARPPSSYFQLHDLNTGLSAQVLFRGELASPTVVDPLATPFLVGDHSDNRVIGYGRPVAVADLPRGDIAHYHWDLTFAEVQ